MNLTKQLSNYINSNNKLDIDRIIDDFTPYIKTVINNSSKDNLSYEDKEEILIDTFFILWKNQSNNITYLDAYLAGIAKNLVREKFKKNNITYDISDYENVLGYYDYIDLLSEKREKLNKLKVSYKSLNEIDLKIINMFYYSNKSIKEIAKELNFSVENIKTKLHRIRKKLKKKLEIGGF